MKSIGMVVGFAGTAGVMLLTGCSMQLAEQPRSEVETRWAEEISASYPGWRPPRTYAQAVEFQSPNASGAATAEASASEREEIPAAAPDHEQESAAPTAAIDPLNEDAAPEQAVDQAAGSAAPAAEAKADAPEAAEKAAVPEVKATETAPVETPAASAANATEVVVKPGDTLTGLSKQFYGDAKYFEVILRANPQVTDPKKLKIGTKLVIPAL